MGIVTSSPSGAEVVLTILDAGDWFGEVAIFAGATNSHDAVARGACELAFVPVGACHVPARFATGFQPGDLILSINGVQTSGLDLNTINGFFNNKPGKKINMVVDRKGQQLKLNFELADQI